MLVRTAEAEKYPEYRHTIYTKVDMPMLEEVWEDLKRRFTAGELESYKVEVIKK